MKEYYPLTFLLFYLLFSACNSPINSITIKGNIKNYDGEKVYAKQIDVFSYHNNSLLDSAIVDENGAFEFELNRSVPLLLNLSKYNRQHPIHGLLQEDPERYYYGYCAMFYIPEPTLYLDESSVIDLDWTVKERLDSYAFDYANADPQNAFYKYYLEENLSKELYDEGGNFKQITTEKAWGFIEQAINEVLEKYKVQAKGKENSLQNYLHTEIQLGGINMFLNWFDHIHKEQLEQAFSLEVLPGLYTKAFDIYSKEEWNSQSVACFKMTERFITFNLNKSYRKFEQYYPPNEEKMTMARKVLNSSIVDKYIANIRLNSE